MVAAGMLYWSVPSCWSITGSDWWWQTIMVGDKLMDDNSCSYADWRWMVVCEWWFIRSVDATKHCWYKWTKWLAGHVCWMVVSQYDYERKTVVSSCLADDGWFRWCLVTRSMLSCYPTTGVTTITTHMVLRVTSWVCNNVVAGSPWSSPHILDHPWPW